MSRFFDPKLSALTPYTPGEQPRDRLLLKLNTNESPFPPSPLAQRYAREEAGRLELYSDPCCTALVKKGAEVFGVEEDEIIFTNGSDEVLDFTFQAFAPRERSSPTSPTASTRSSPPSTRSPSPRCL